MQRPIPTALAALLGALALEGGRLALPATATTAAPATESVAPLRSDPQDGLRGFAAAFRRTAREVGPAVVSVRSWRESRRGDRTRRWQAAQGSGVVLQADGIVVTNHHVVEGGSSFTCSFTDEREIPARLVGVDPDTDLAVLDLEGEGYPTAELIREGDGTVGEWVLAVGNPLGIGTTITAGIVSGKGRHDLGITTFEDFLQTDAAINPGNSGGPLVDLDGRVLGINTAMGTLSGGTNGLGFAIPAKIVRRVLDEILEEGRVRRGWLGIEMDWFSDSRARAHGFAGDSRVMISRIVPGGPAERAGLAVGDIVLGVGDRAVLRSRDLLEAIAGNAPGARVDVRVWRDGAEVELEAVLAERPIER